ncbi:MAG: hypothetical protein J7L14_00075 [Candidatus Diapherotrites archaeon]|nr:hypothetical protein [Candidatus Diapherotrites archaeon]
MGDVLLATVGAGRGSWGHIARLINERQWERVILIGTEWVKQNFKVDKEVEWLLVASRSGFEGLKTAILERIPDNANIFVSIASGTGREHAALLAALKEKQKDYKIVLLTKNGITEI